MLPDSVSIAVDPDISVGQFAGALRAAGLDIHFNGGGLHVRRAVGPVVVPGDKARQTVVPKKRSAGRARSPAVVRRPRMRREARSRSSN